MKKRILIFLALTAVISVFLLVFANGAQNSAVYIKDGGSGDGTTAENAAGDFRYAVKKIKKNGGTIVVCGRYTVDELICLSSASGTSNGKRTITVTSEYGGIDYKKTEDAQLVFGDGKNSANLMLAGDFVFEKLVITTSGNKERYIIAEGNKLVLGEGIECRKNGDSPFISVIGGSLDQDYNKKYDLTIKSGSYNNVCASNRDLPHVNDCSLNIEGGVFEGNVSVSGLLNRENSTNGKTTLVVKNGVFNGNIGALTNCNQTSVRIDGGTFNGNIYLYGQKNTVDINGGTMQSLKEFYVGVPTVDADENDENKKDSVVNVNEYYGDVAILSSKIKGERFELNIKTAGGTDAVTVPIHDETTAVQTETQTEQIQGETEIVTDVPEENTADEKQETRKNNVLGIIILIAVIFSASVLFAYRTVNRRK